MNRAQRRANAARERMQHNSERVKALVEQKNDLAQKGEWFRMLLFATARREGRLLVKASDIEALGENDRIDFVRRENGDVVVEYTKG